MYFSTDYQYYILDGTRRLTISITVYLKIILPRKKGGIVRHPGVQFDFSTFLWKRFSKPLKRQNETVEVGCSGND